jgi:hypothetical protein
LVRFMSTAEFAGGHELERERLLGKGLLPGRLVYTFTYPLWHLPKARPYFFIITRAWGYMERMAQRHELWPDFLTLMAGPRRAEMLGSMMNEMHSMDESRFGAVPAARAALRVVRDLRARAATS